jgi:ABC-type antimicrobial peptide transport system permease subunit
VTGDTRAAWSSGAPERQTIYMPESLFATPGSVVAHMRTAGDPISVSETVRRAVWQVNQHQPVSDLRTLDEILSEDLRSRDRWLAILFGIFSTLALSLAAIGLYSVVSLAVTQRSREFGIRMALGAQRKSILSLVLFSEFAIVLSGIAFGVAMSLLAGKLLESMIDARMKDAWFLPMGSLLLVAVTMLASYFPARRASRIEPMKSLRAE